MFKADRLLYHSTIGLRVIKKKRSTGGGARELFVLVRIEPSAVHEVHLIEEGRYKATWKREFKLPWHEAGPPNHHDDKVDSDQ